MERGGRRWGMEKEAPSSCGGKGKEWGAEGGSGGEWGRGDPTL